MTTLRNLVNRVKALIASHKAIALAVVAAVVQVATSGASWRTAVVSLVVGLVHRFLPGVS